MKDENEDLFLKGCILQDEKKYKEAIRVYNEVLHVNPEHEKALLNKGHALFSINKNTEALQFFEKINSLNPDNFYAWLFKGIVFYNLKKYFDAIESFDKALLVDPNSGIAFYERGLALFAQGNPEEALVDYEQALIHSPSGSDQINLDKYEALKSLGRCQEAEELRKTVRRKGVKKNAKEIVDTIDAYTFANVLKNTQLVDNQIHFGKFVLTGCKGVIEKIRYSESDFQLLGRSQEYTFPLLSGELKISIQMFYSSGDYWTIDSSSKCNGKTGVIFSVNLSSDKDAKGAIFLTQKLIFTERFKGNKKIAEAHRRMKQSIFAELLRKLHFDVTDNNDVILGIFDTDQGTFVNTTPEKFLEDFIVISILKGHFMGNKGYDLEIMPSYNLIQKLSESYDANIDPNKIPEKFVEQKGKRTISFSMRFKVLNRDGRKCVICGRSQKDGVKLHVDHIRPYSLGGLTSIENLQTLCEECNLGKGNRFIG